MGTEERWYDDVLLLHPGREMNRYLWGQVLRELLWFANGFEVVKLYIDVLETEEGAGALAR